MTATEQSILLKFIKTLSTEESQAQEQPLAPVVSQEDTYELIPELQRRRKMLTEVQPDFKPGDIIVWKDGLKNKRLPDYEQPCVVVKVYETPLTATNDVTISEKVDFEIAFITEDDDFLCFNYDSARFQLQKSADDQI